MKHDPWNRFCDAMQEIHKSQQKRREDLRRIEDETRKVVTLIIEKHERTKR